jgi:hypothetical protein
MSERRLSALVMLSAGKNLLESLANLKKVVEECSSQGEGNRLHLQTNCMYGFTPVVNLLYTYLFLLLYVVKLF